ncbi:hypothetical protein HDU86_003322 [Geranomyces michiganensis]|nr:hypothetical protein HDU86_003322 [Geranomyces michiganensis]
MPSSWETVNVSKKKKDLDSSPKSKTQQRQSTPSKSASASTTPRTPSGYFAALEDAPLPDGSAGSDDESRPTAFVAKATPKKAPAQAPVLKKQTTASNPSPPVPKESPKAARRAQDVDYGLSQLATLDVPALEAAATAVPKAPPADALKLLSEILEAEINKLGNVSMPSFASKSFALHAVERHDPLSHTPQAVVELLSRTLEQLDVRRGYAALARNLIEAEKKASAAGKSNIRSTIAPTIILELIGHEYPDLFDDENSPLHELVDSYKTSYGQNPAVGHTLVWICAQQGHSGGRKFTVRPHGISVWMHQLLPIWTGPSSNAVSTEAVSLEYLEMLLSSLHNLKGHAQHITHLAVNDIVALLRVAKAKHPHLDAKKNGKRARAVFGEAYVLLKKAIFSAKPKHSLVVLKEAPAEAFTSLLAELETETDPSVHHELLDMLIHLLTAKSTGPPAGAGYHSPVVRAWVAKYDSHIIASRLLIRHLVDHGKHSKIWKNHERRAEMLRAVKNMRSQNDRLFKKIDKRRQRVAGGTVRATEIVLAHPEMSTDDVNAVEHELQVLQKQLASRSFSFTARLLRLTLWSLFAYFLWYTTNDVLCAPGSNLPCPTSHPKYREFKHQVWDKKLVPAYIKGLRAVDDVTKPYVAPAAAAARKAVQPARDRFDSKWARFRKTKEYTAVHEACHEFAQVWRAYANPWTRRVSTEVHEFVALAVRTTVPAMQTAYASVKTHAVTQAPHVRAFIARWAIQARRIVTMVVDKVVYEVTQSLTRLRVLELAERYGGAHYETSVAELKTIVNECVSGIDFVWRIVEDRVDKKEWKGIKRQYKETWTSVLGTLKSWTGSEQTKHKRE